MVQLIADSGSTKTDWYLCQEQNVTHLKTRGCNPFAVSADWIRQELTTHLLPLLTKQVRLDAIDHVHFYGAGCNKGEGQERMEYILKNVFDTTTAIFVHSDLLAAARALCGQEAGICLIMGTGSNVCWYNGQDITVDLPALGYLLGDEGGGYDLGKRLVKDYFRQKMPTDLQQQFEEDYTLNYQDYLEKAYKQPAPNAYLANFAKFCVQHKKNYYIQNLVKKSFGVFFEERINYYKKYNTQQLYGLGSIATYFQHELNAIAHQHGFVINTVIQSPFPKLVDFHQKVMSL